ncbi:MAG: hypothetical protein ACK4YF_08740, partial [Exilispira sp.]
INMEIFLNYVKKKEVTFNQQINDRIDIIKKFKNIDDEENNIKIKSEKNDEKTQSKKKNEDKMMIENTEMIEDKYSYLIEFINNVFYDSNI